MIGSRFSWQLASPLYQQVSDIVDKKLRSRIYLGNELLSTKISFVKHRQLKGQGHMQIQVLLSFCSLFSQIDASIFFFFFFFNGTVRNFLMASLLQKIHEYSVSHPRISHTYTHLHIFTDSIVLRWAMTLWKRHRNHTINRAAFVCLSVCLFVCLFPISSEVLWPIFAKLGGCM